MALKMGLWARGVLAVVVGAGGVVALRAHSLGATGALAASVGQGHQIAAGQQVFREICAVCHGDQGEGGEGPPLIGPGNFLADFRTAQGLFDFIREAMPNDDPGSLQDQQYYDVLAFLLARNNFNPGGLPVDATTVEGIGLVPCPPAEEAIAGAYRPSAHDAHPPV